MKKSSATPATGSRAAHDRAATASSCFAAARVVAAEVAFRSRPLATPLHLSSGVIVEVTEAQAVVDVEAGARRRRGRGRGVVSLSDLWAWPRGALDRAQRVAALRAFCQTLAAELPRLAGRELVHPAELGLRLHAWARDVADVPGDPPPLARALCASPLDAALHDAVGNALETSAFALFDDLPPLPAADRYFAPGGAARAIRGVLGPPRRELPAWLVVHAADDVEATVADAVRRAGYRSFKLKIAGADPRRDAAETARVHRAASAAAGGSVTLSIDSNEGHAGPAAVREYLHALERIDPAAYRSVAYLEQPTSREIQREAFDWRPVTAHKPVLLDEGLTDLEILPIARRQGWSGLALKTCKGHSLLLASAAWAQHNGLALTLQDLTNPGIGLIHAALVGARLPTLNGVELNSPQFTPAANREFLPRLSPLFEPRDGVHRLPQSVPPGLGSCL